MSENIGRGAARLLLALCLAATAACSGKEEKDSIAPSTRSVEQLVPEIRERCEKVRRSLSAYRRVDRDVTGLSAEGGELTAYLDGDRVVWIAAALYGETGRSDQELCYDGGHLLSVARKESRYDQPMGKVAEVLEDRLYFRDGKLIRRSGAAGQPLPPVVEEERNVLNLSRRLLETAHPAGPPG
ncbi:MAG TPA: hypothetical protein VKK31_20300 [Thermoanaerobaculia bacterium]|nr:hypothetical protein [Thermoanaerobaculia bacterium]